MAASGLSCGMWDLRWGMRDLSLQWVGFSLVVTQPSEHVGSAVCSTRALQLRCMISVVVAHRLNCPTACGILVPWPGIEPMSPALEGRQLDHQGSPCFRLTSGKIVKKAKFASWSYTGTQNTWTPLPPTHTHTHTHTHARIHTAPAVGGVGSSGGSWFIF